ncbi:BAG family molecular chaperone regulator 5 [Spatholobus suberectus]|nr:BAG family molecular chaperone regulator 5 [Spatholobus suberectus]
MQTKNMNIPTYRTRWGGYRAPSKVVSVPVHFVASERARTDSATKIQKVLRGFLVRNTVRKMGAVRVELERIESEVNVELVKREERERVRVIETVMNLLLRLDSVRVLHYSGLRECRKSLINKAIALQEMLDQVGGVADSEGVKMEEKEGECVGGENCLVKGEEGNGMEALGNGEVENEDGCMEEESVVLGTSLVEEKEGEIESEEQVEGEEIECLRNEEMEEEDGEGGMGFVEEKQEEGDCEGGDEKKRELLEKMVEDNEKMMEMMAQLFRRNEMQTRLLTSLSHRVEQLERAFACEKLRRKKKKNADAINKSKNDPKNGCI